MHNAVLIEVLQLYFHFTMLENIIGNVMYLIPIIKSPPGGELDS